MRRPTGTFLAGLLLTACSASESDPTPPVADSALAASRSRLGPALEAAAPLRERARHAFRASPDGLESGDATFAVRVTAESTEFRPVHHDGPDEPLVGAPARLRTASVRRATGDELALPSAGPTVDALGVASRPLRAGVAEELQSSRAGLEQRWRFAAAPAGAGDLHVRVEPGDYDFVSTSAAGQHFVDPASGLGLVYGHATWIDAAGTRTALPVGWDGVRLAIAVPAALVDGSRYPVVLDPIVSGEVAVGLPVSGPPAHLTQQAPAIACASARCLVAWTDDRRGKNGASAVYATRIDENGTILDPAGIAVGPGTGDQRPDVATDGTDFVVVFQRGASTTSRIWAQKVLGETGGLGVAAEVVSATTGASVTQPAVAYGLGRYLVAWTDDTSADDVRVRLLDATTLALLSAPNVLAAQAGNQRQPALTFLPGRSQFYAVWQSDENGNEDIFARPITPSSGLPNNVRRAATTAAGHQTNPDVTTDGSFAQIVWQDQRGGTWDIYANRGSLAFLTHSMQNGSGYLVRGDGSGQEVNPSIGFSAQAQQFFVVWESYRSGQFDLYGERLTAAGTHVATQPVLVTSAAGTELAPDVAGWVGSSFLTHMVAFADSAGDVRATRMGTFFGWGSFDFPGLVLGTQWNRQLAPSVATDGASFLVVWTDHRKPDVMDSDIYAARVTVDAAGIATVVGGEIPVATGPSPQSRPDVTFDGTHYVVVWSDERDGGADGDVYAARITPAGVVLDDNGFAVASSPSENEIWPAVTAAGGRWFVVWTKGDAFGPSGLRGRQYSGAIPLIDWTLVDGGARPFEPDVASDGSDFYVVWGDNRAGASAKDLYGVAVSATGVQGPPTLLATGAGDEHLPQVAFGAGAYEVLFSQCSISWSNDECAAGVGDIGVRRVTSAGTPLGGGFIGSDPTAETTPALAWNGARFQTVWSWRFNAGPQAFESGARGNLIQPDGSFDVASAEDWISAVGQGRHRRPRLACRASDGTCLVAYERFESSVGAERVDVRSVRP